MKKKYYSLLMLSALILSSCRITRDLTRFSSSSTSQGPEDTMQMIIDEKYQSGFLVEPATGQEIETGWVPPNRVYSNTNIQYGGYIGNPLWRVRQHNDVYGLGDVYSTKEVEYNVSTGYYEMEDPSKKIFVSPTKSAIYLELNTSKEYMYRDLRQDEDWCHLLLEGGFHNDKYTGEGVQFSDLKACRLHMNIERKKFENHMYSTPISSFHACQFLLYFIVASKAPGDDGEGKYFFLGVPLFDNRYKVIPESGQIDTAGTGQFIYNANSTYLPNSLPLNEVQEINLDIKPLLNKALPFAHKKNAFTHSTVDDLYFLSFNIGYEIPGTYDIGIEMSNFTLTAVYN